jgi:hypothetical protein
MNVGVSSFLDAPQYWLGSNQHFPLIVLVYLPYVVSGLLALPQPAPASA